MDLLSSLPIVYNRDALISVSIWYQEEIKVNAPDGSELYWVMYEQNWNE